MEIRNKYITKTSEKILSNANKQYNLNLDSDPQLHELIRGISILHASKQYEDQFAFQNSLDNLKYNIDVEFDTAAHGLIQLQPSKELSIPQGFIFRSLDCIYQTKKQHYFHNAKLIHQSIITRYNQRFIELKLLGDIDGKLEFFTHNELIDAIFKDKETINILGFDGAYYQCKKEINGDIFQNINCSHLTSFYINIQSSKQFILYIPIESKITQLHTIYINCAIVENKFTIESIPSTNTIKLPQNIYPIKFNYIKNTLGKVIPHRRNDINGWYITLNNDSLFTNINNTCIANMTCRNINLNTTTCQSEIFIPSTNTTWIILPNNHLTKNSIQYMNSNSLEMFEHLAKLCDIEYKNLTIEETVLSHLHNKQYYTYEYGQIIRIELLNNNYTFLKLIENEINKYHNVQIQEQ